MGFQLKYARLAGGLWLAAFVGLMVWAPLDNLKTNDDSITQNEALDQEEGVWTSHGLTSESLTIDFSKGNMDPKVRAKLCNARQGLDVNSIAFAEIRRQIGAAENTEKEKLRKQLILDELILKTGELCKIDELQKQTLKLKLDL